MQTIIDLLIAVTDYRKTSQTITDPLIDFTDRYKTSPTRYKLLPPTMYYTI